jgi:hypothetical protein
VQQETETIDAVISCLASASTADPEWPAALTDFKSENARTRVLHRILPIEIQYHSRAQPLADDARLGLEYPGTW